MSSIFFHVRVSISFRIHSCPRIIVLSHSFCLCRYSASGRPVRHLGASLRYVVTRVGQRLSEGFLYCAIISTQSLGHLWPSLLDRSKLEYLVSIHADLAEPQPLFHGPTKLSPSLSLFISSTLITSGNPLTAVQLCIYRLIPQGLCRKSLPSCLFLHDWMNGCAQTAKRRSQ